MNTNFINIEHNVIEDLKTKGYLPVKSRSYNAIKFEENQYFVIKSLAIDYNEANEAFRKSDLVKLCNHYKETFSKSKSTPGKSIFVYYLTEKGIFLVVNYACYNVKGFPWPRKDSFFLELKQNKNFDFFIEIKKQIKALDIPGFKLFNERDTFNFLRGIDLSLSFVGYNGNPQQGNSLEQIRDSLFKYNRIELSIVDLKSVIKVLKNHRDIEQVENNNSLFYPNDIKNKRQALFTFESFYTDISDHIDYDIGDTLQLYSIKLPEDIDFDKIEIPPVPKEPTLPEDVDFDNIGLPPFIGFKRCKKGHYYKETEKKCPYCVKGNKAPPRPPKPESKKKGAPKAPPRPPKPRLTPTQKQQILEVINEIPVGGEAGLISFIKENEITLEEMKEAGLEPSKIAEIEKIDNTLNVETHLDFEYDYSQLLSSVDNIKKTPHSKRYAKLFSDERSSISKINNIKEEIDMLFPRERGVNWVSDSIFLMLLSDKEDPLNEVKKVLLSKIDDLTIEDHIASSKIDTNENSTSYKKWEDSSLKYGLLKLYRKEFLEEKQVRIYFESLLENLCTEIKEEFDVLLNPNLIYNDYLSDLKIEFDFDFNGGWENINDLSNRAFFSHLNDLSDDNGPLFSNELNKLPSFKEKKDTFYAYSQINLYFFLLPRLIYINDGNKFLKFTELVMDLNDAMSNLDYSECYKLIFPNENFSKPEFEFHYEKGNYNVLTDLIDLPTTLTKPSKEKAGNLFIGDYYFVLRNLSFFKDKAIAKNHPKAYDLLINNYILLDETSQVNILKNNDGYISTNLFDYYISKKIIEKSNVFNTIKESFETSPQLLIPPLEKYNLILNYSPYFYSYTKDVEGDDCIHHVFNDSLAEDSFLVENITGARGSDLLKSASKVYLTSNNSLICVKRSPSIDADIIEGVFDYHYNKKDFLEIKYSQIPDNTTFTKENLEKIKVELLNTILEKDKSKLINEYKAGLKKIEVLEAEIAKQKTQIDEYSLQEIVTEDDLLKDLTFVKDEAELKKEIEKEILIFFKRKDIVFTTYNQFEIDDDEIPEELKSGAIISNKKEYGFLVKLDIDRNNIFYLKAEWKSKPISFKPINKYGKAISYENMLESLKTKVSFLIKAKKFYESSFNGLHMENYRHKVKNIIEETSGVFNNISETETDDILKALKSNYFNSEDEIRDVTAFDYILEQKMKFFEQNDQLTKAYKYLLRIIDDDEDFDIVDLLKDKYSNIYKLKTPSEEAIVYNKKDLIDLALDDLIDNAKKYGKKDSIAITLTKENNWWLITIANTIEKPTLNQSKFEKLGLKKIKVKSYSASTGTGIFHASDKLKQIGCNLSFSSFEEYQKGNFKVILKIKRTHYD